MGSRLLRFAPIACFLFLLAGCILPKEGSYAPSESKPRPLAEETRKTRTLAVFLDGKPVGYLMTFLDDPAKEGGIPKDTRFIQNLDFHNLGFISPLGKTFRYGTEGRVIEVCQRSVEQALAVFFESPLAKVELKPLTGK